MIVDKLLRRVTVETCALVLALATAGAILGGMSGGVGVLAGGALAVVNFRWLGRPAPPGSRWQDCASPRARRCARRCS